MKSFYSHFLITRFNVRINTMLPKQLEQIDITRNEQYLDERFRLFYKYTVPSVINQSSKKFTWILLFSSNTPIKYKNKLKQLAKLKDIHIKILYINDSDDYLMVLKNYIYSNLSTDYYITSRVDNDDCLSINYMQNIQAYVDKMDYKHSVIIFNNGYQYDELCKISTFYHFDTNHFSSLVSHIDDRDVIIEYNHMDINKFLPVINIDNSNPMWLEVVHNSNITNRMHLKSDNFIYGKDLLKQFGLDIELQDLSKSRKTINIVMQKPKNFFRLYRQYGLKKCFKKFYEKFTKKFLR